MRVGALLLDTYWAKMSLAPGTPQNRAHSQCPQNTVRQGVHDGLLACVHLGGRGACWARAWVQEGLQGGVGGRGVCSCRAGLLGPDLPRVLGLAVTQAGTWYR